MQLNAQSEHIFIISTQNKKQSILSILEAPLVPLPATPHFLPKDNNRFALKKKPNNFMCIESYSLHSFLFGFFCSTLYLRDSSMLLHVAGVYSHCCEVFHWMNISQSIYPFYGRWAFKWFPVCWPLRMVLLWIFLCMSLKHICGHFCWLQYLGVEMLGHRACKRSALVGTAKLFPKWL